MTLAIQCSCGAPDIIALRPGVEPLRRGAVDLFTRLDPLVEIGEPATAWCAACWDAKFGTMTRRGRGAGVGG